MRCAARRSTRFPIVEPTFALTNGGSITSFGVPLTENFDSLASDRNRPRVDGQFDDSRLVLDAHDLQLGHRIVEHRSALQLRRRQDEPGHRSRPGVGRVRRHRHGLPGRQAHEQHRRHDHVAGHQLRGRAVAKRRQHDRPHAHIPVPGRQCRRHHRRQYSISGWTTFAPLSFTGPVATATAAALDGNAPANRSLKSATLAVTVNAGQEIWLRWQDPDDAGNDHGLAIDDFSVTANGVTVENAPARHHHDPGKRSDQRRRQLEHRHQFQRERQRERRRVRRSMPGGLAAGVRAERLARQHRSR